MYDALLASYQWKITRRSREDQPTVEPKRVSSNPIFLATMQLTTCHASLLDDGDSMSPPPNLFNSRQRVSTRPSSLRKESTPRHGQVSHWSWHCDSRETRPAQPLPSLRRHHCFVDGGEFRRAPCVHGDKEGPISFSWVPGKSNRAATSLATGRASTLSIPD